MHVEPQHRTVAKGKTRRRETFKSTFNRNKNSHKEDRAGSARRANARQTRQVQNTKTFPSRGNKAKEVYPKRTSTTQKGPTARMKEAGWLHQWHFARPTRAPTASTPPESEMQTRAQPRKKGTKPTATTRTSTTQGPSTPSSSSSSISGSTAVIT